MGTLLANECVEMARRLATRRYEARGCALYPERGLETRSGSRGFVVYSEKGLETRRTGTRGFALYSEKRLETRRSGTREFAEYSEKMFARELHRLSAVSQGCWGCLRPSAVYLWNRILSS